MNSARHEEDSKFPEFRSFRHFPVQPAKIEEIMKFDSFLAPFRSFLPSRLQQETRVTIAAALNPSSLQKSPAGKQIFNPHTLAVRTSPQKIIQCNRDTAFNSFRKILPASKFSLLIPPLIN